MNIVFSPSPESLGLNRARTGAASDTPRTRNPSEGGRGLAALVLAAVVSALVALSDQLIGRWTDDHLFFGWVAMWLVILTGTAVFGKPVRHLARRAVALLQGWARALAEARAERQLWNAAHRDPRLLRDLKPASQRDFDDEQNDRRGWGRFPERLREGHEQRIHLNHP